MMNLLLLWPALIPVMNGAPAVSDLPDGFAEHVVAVPGGRIDWTRGCLLVEGLGRARGTAAQQRLMALRAAEVVAARNALAMAAGVPIDADGRIGAVAGGSVHVEGVVRGQHTVRAEWRPDARPPEARLTLEVPLWGVDGIASVCWRTRQIRARYGRERISLAAPGLAGERVFVVIDARGLAATECLFPTIADPSGRVLYDLATLATAIAPPMPPVRYVTSGRPMGSEAATQPVNERAAGESTIVVKAARVAGPQRTELVLSAADAGRLAASPQASAALHSGRVLILVGQTARVAP